MALIKSISGIRGTIGGKPGEGLSPIDVVTFAAACSESGELSSTDIKLIASMRGIIPSPALCLIKVELFLEIMKILKNVCMIFIKNYFPSII